MYKFNENLNALPISACVNETEAAVTSGESGRELNGNLKSGAKYSAEMGVFLKYMSLGILILQTTLLVLTLRYSRILSSKTGVQYLSSTAVVMVELTKLFICCLIIWYQKGFAIREFVKTVQMDIVDRPLDTMKMLVPSGLYIIQNNLLYAALTNLDAATYQVTYQLKILTTAMFSVFMLNKHLETFQWISLVMLVIGVSLVQVAGAPTKISITSSQIVGFAAVLAACFSSGFAGVYFEKILKNTQQSIWIRNIQLGLFGLLFGLFGVLLNDFNYIKQGGFFQGYSDITWLVICLQAFGGLLVAVVIKYADNILKSFAASLSIILSVIFSYFVLGDLTTSRYFLFGTTLVVASTFLYTYQPRNVPITDGKGITATI